MLATITAALFALLIGSAFCFFGYRVFMVMLPIWGFFAGFWLGSQVTVLLFGSGFLATTTGWIIGFIAGLIGAVLSYAFYQLGIAFIAAGFGLALGIGIMNLAGFETGLLPTLVGISSAAVIAILTLVLNIQKYVVMAITAIGGANAMVVAPMLLIGAVTLEQLRQAGNAIVPLAQAGWVWGLAWLLLAIAGFAAQLRVNREFEFNQQRYREAWG